MKISLNKQCLLWVQTAKLVRYLVDYADKHCRLLGSRWLDPAYYNVIIASIRVHYYSITNQEIPAKYVCYVVDNKILSTETLLNVFTNTPEQVEYIQALCNRCASNLKELLEAEKSTNINTDLF